MFVPDKSADQTVHCQITFQAKQRRHLCKHGREPAERRARKIVEPDFKHLFGQFQKSSLPGYVAPIESGNFPQGMLNVTFVGKGFSISKVKLIPRIKGHKRYVILQALSE